MKSLRDTSDSDLIILLQMGNSDQIINLMRFDDRRMRQYIAKKMAGQQWHRVNAMLPEGLGYGSFPVQVANILIGLGLIASSSIFLPFLIMVAASTVMITVGMTSAESEERQRKEKIYLKKQLILECKIEIVKFLQNRIRKTLEKEYRHLASQEPKLKEIPFKTFIQSENKSNFLVDLGLHCSNNYRPIHLTTPLHRPPKENVSPVVPFFGWGAAICFNSMFWGSVSILKLFGFAAFASVLFTPMSIAAILLFTIGVGLYTGYHRYKYEQYRVEIKNNLQQLEYEQQCCLHEYNKEKILLQQLKAIRLEKSNETQNPRSTPAVANSILDLSKGEKLSAPSVAKMLPSSLWQNPSNKVDNDAKTNKGSEKESMLSVQCSLAPT